MEKKPYPTTNKFNPSLSPPVPIKKKKKKKKPTRFEPVCVCVARRARANGQTVRNADVCIASLTQFETFATGCVSPLQTNNKRTNKQTHRITDRPRSLSHARGL